MVATKGGEGRGFCHCLVSHLTLCLKNALQVSYHLQALRFVRHFYCGELQFVQEFLFAPLGLPSLQVLTAHILLQTTYCNGTSKQSTGLQPLTAYVLKILDLEEYSPTQEKLSKDINDIDSRFPSRRALATQWYWFKQAPSSEGPGQPETSSQELMGELKTLKSPFNKSFLVNVSGILDFISSSALSCRVLNKGKFFLLSQKKHLWNVSFKNWKFLKIDGLKREKLYCNTAWS